MTPEYVMCLECETPSYVFEWEEGRITEILCEQCGNDDPEQFVTGEEYDQLVGM
jgi:translation initiation factor 2 beta subunit (eIF-2beta)/eIF-5